MDVCSGHLDRPHHGERLWYHCCIGSHRSTWDLENWVDKYRGGGDKLWSGDRGLLPVVLRSNVLVRDSHHGGDHSCGCLGSGGRGHGVRGHKHSYLVWGHCARRGWDLYDRLNTCPWFGARAWFLSHAGVRTGTNRRGRTALA